MSQCNTMLKRGGGVAVHVVFLFRKIVASLTSSRHQIASGKPTPAHMAGITEAAQHGTLAPKIARIVPPSEAIPALTELEINGAPKGKLIIAETDAS